MRAIIIVIAGSIALASCATPGFESAGDAEVLARGRSAYEVRCMGCHEPATPGAPNRTQLAAMPADSIVSALMTGKMKLMAIDLPEAEAREIAAYLTR